MKNNIKGTEYYLRYYMRERPVFLSLIRAKEAQLFSKYLPFGKPVLDVGSGDGYFAKTAFSGNSQISIHKSQKPLIDVGLDVEDSRVEESRILNVYKKIVIYDGGKMPFGKNTFGTVVSNCVLEHIPDLEKTVSEVYRVLKPGGLFITTVATKNWEDYLFGNLIFGEVYKRWMRKKQVHFNLLTSHGWNGVFRKAGFKVIEETGYLDRKAVRWIDIWHYLSIPSLLSYKLTGKWVLWKNMVEYINTGFLNLLVEKDMKAESGGNIFYALKK